MLQPNLALAVLRVDPGVGWSPLGERLVGRLAPVDPAVLAEGVLLVVAAGLPDDDLAAIHGLPRGRGGVVWLRPAAGATKPPDQIIGLDANSGSVVLRRPGHDVLVDVPATVSGPVAESGGRHQPPA